MIFHHLLSPVQTLSTIAENLLRDPDNPKFRQFKPTNTIIKRDLVDPKGTLEYAVAVRRVFMSPVSLLSYMPIYFDG
jgi:hypothetical protein